MLPGQYKWIIITVQYSLMWLKSWGWLTACQRLWRYLMWLAQLLMRELKMQLRACLRKKRLLMMRRHLQQGSTVHILRRSAMVLMVFFSCLIAFLKLWKGSLCCSSSARIFFSFFSMKDMMPFPKFLGMFFVSFFSRRSSFRLDSIDCDSSALMSYCGCDWEIERSSRWCECSVKARGCSSWLWSWWCDG